MSPRDFFRIVLKILALLFIVNGIVPATSSIITYFGDDSNVFIALIILNLIYVIITIVVFAKTDSIIKYLRLESGYESEHFEFGQPHSGKIIRLACIIAGLYMMFESVPDILVESLIYLKLDVSESLFNDFNLNSEYFLLKSVFKLFFGLLLVLLRHRIAGLFSSK